MPVQSFKSPVCSIEALGAFTSKGRTAKSREALTRTGPRRLATACRNLVATLACLAGLFLASCASAAAAKVTGTARSADGVEIAYTTWGEGQPALVFIHGGFADQDFWREQASLASDFQLVTLDLAGHGQSGSNRETWSIGAFGNDVRAVVEALQLEEVVLVGNSLGGPVGLSAARSLPAAIGLIAVDTFQDVDQQWPREQLEAYIKSLQENFPATCKQMMVQLLSEHTKPELAEWVEQRMCSFDPENAHRVVSGFLDYEEETAFAAAEIPIRAIMGETVPLDIEGNRRLQAHFDAVVMTGCGHYPMLERPEEFNRNLRAFVAELEPTSVAPNPKGAQAENDRRLDYIEFQTDHIETTKAFYSAVFGWQFTDYGPTYTSFSDGRLSGGFDATLEPSKGGPLVVIYATNLSQIEALVREHGGRVSRDIFEFPGGRRFHFTDPSGNELAVWSE